MTSRKFYTFLCFLGGWMITLAPLQSSAQPELDQYLSTHKYALNIQTQEGTSGLAAMFKDKLAGYKVLFLGEGGSHQLDFYNPLTLYFLQLLNRSMGVRSFALEYGSAVALLYNKYLLSGDTSYLPSFKTQNTMHFLRTLYEYNRSGGSAHPLRNVGIDFERPQYYWKALRTLLSERQPPPELQEEVNTITAPLDSTHCDAFVVADRLLKKSLKEKASAYQSYFGDNFRDAENIISNQGSCKDVYKNRNYNLKRRFELFDSQLGDSLYYAELGQAHVDFKLKNASWLLNTDKKSAFYQKVAVINVYCYNCTSPEGISNWALKSIDKNIRERFLPQCEADFTLFDLTGPDSLLARYREHGQFLLVVKNQH